MKIMIRILLLWSYESRPPKPASLFSITSQALPWKRSSWGGVSSLTRATCGSYSGGRGSGGGVSSCPLRPTGRLLSVASVYSLAINILCFTTEEGPECTAARWRLGQRASGIVLFRDLLTVLKNIGNKKVNKVERKRKQKKVLGVVRRS